MKLIYLATPYSTPDLRLRNIRYEQACLACRKLLKDTSHINIYCPIVHWHPIAQSFTALQNTDEAWAARNKDILRISDELCVLRLRGWRESPGVKAEIAFAEQEQKPIWYLDETFVEAANGND